jgi:hypothetical protein
MNLWRLFTLCLLALSVSAATVVAQSWPAARPITVVVPFPPGPECATRASPGCVEARTAPLISLTSKSHHAQYGAV